MLASGGVPVYVRSIGMPESEVLLGALIEASRSLSALIGSGHAQKIAFQEDTLIITETKKGYTVVMLVDRAESYMERLLSVVAEALDRSPVPSAEDAVTQDTQEIVQETVDLYVLEAVSTPITEVLARVWEPLRAAIESDDRFREAYVRVREILSRPERTEEWNELASTVSASREMALEYAMSGNFDYACAASIGLSSPAERVFAIKMGALAHSMVNTTAPPLSLLVEVADGLPDDYPFTDLARRLVAHLSGEIAPADYARALRRAITETELVDSEDSLLTGFLFLDGRVTGFPEFADRLIDLYADRTTLVSSYFEAVRERQRIFDRLYSVTSFDAFRGDLAVYRSRMGGVIERASALVRTGAERSPLEKDVIGALTVSFRIQNFIALLTALCESPILVLGERAEILKEIIRVYEQQFLGLIDAGFPLFSFTLDSVFQSLSVALAEYYHIATGQERVHHLDKMLEFISRIHSTLFKELPKAHLRFSLLVIENALLPVFTRAGILQDQELRLLVLALETLDVNTLDAIHLTRPEYYTTEIGNLISALTAVAHQVLPEEEKSRVLPFCIAVALQVHLSLLSRGVVCRDDIVSLTHHVLLSSEYLSDEELHRVVEQVLALNMVAIQDIEQFDHEVPMVASPLIGVLEVAADRLKDSERYRQVAAQIYRACMSAWEKYGFLTKAENFRKKFERVAGW